MRIVIDMQGAQSESRFRGIGRYSLSLTQAIVRNRGDHEIILLLNGLLPESIEPIRAAFNDLLPQKNIQVWYAPGPVRELETANGWRRDVAECIREAFIGSLKPDAVLITSLFEGFGDNAVTSVGKFFSSPPTAVIFYDLIPLLNPETYLATNPIYEKYYRQKIDHLQRADQWLAISASALNESANISRLSSNATVNISTACNSTFQPLEISEVQKQNFLTRLKITQPFILYSGGADARKNLHKLILAYGHLPKTLREIHQLVLAGKMPEGEESALWKTAKSASVDREELLFTGYIADEDLAWLYNLCALFILPSLHEGFGLPALEAMACGAVVIGSNTTSIPEVIGREDALFDPNDEVSISQKLAEVLYNPALHAKLTQHGLQQAKKFSWDESAKRAMTAITNIKFSPVNSDVTLKKNAIEANQNILIKKIAALVPSQISNKEMRSIAHSISYIQTEPKQSQLFIDISELVQRDAGTGIQRVTRSILKELLVNPPEGYIVAPVYATQGNLGYRHARHFTAKMLGTTSTMNDDVIDHQPGDIFLGLDLQHHVVAAQKNYLSALRQDGVKILFVVYDLLPILLPHVFQAGTDSNHKAWLDTLMSFDGALCISRSVADELKIWQRTHGPNRLRPYAIDWFHLGADVANSIPTRGFPADAVRILKQIKQCPSFICVGTIEPRKRQTQVLEALELLWNQDVNVNLVLIGRQGWLVDSLIKHIQRHPELGKRLFWLDGISDEYLEQVYAASTCLIAASEGEGFGLPLIEAAQHKLPIIARDIPVFREVAGEYAHYFQGLHAADLASELNNWLSLYKTGGYPKSDDMPYLTWAQSAEQLTTCLRLDTH
ncbi:glycosyltransferase family 4 protein [Undibacterium parvum]|uniref:Glycosyltransferase family 1 protein n=1 Tax=Undibacterium parvum TaxID=401471 RepID=A0A3Q9BPU5_9BURK|nr:glycosyltransferase family 1 protein [Undibacterium parvum]AZP11725.1 glycosyltransferase family 1 protein [Undibacterium parvum]